MMFSNFISTISGGIHWQARLKYWVAFYLLGAMISIQCSTKNHSQSKTSNSNYGSKAGTEISIAGIRLCWCPPGNFLMGSPRDEPERRPDEDQVKVNLTTGFWMGKVEVTQGQWKAVMGKLPGELTVEGGEGDDIPVYNVN